jgi:esterase/lipase
MEKLLYVIPGFGESTRDKPYRAIASFAKSAGYEVVLYSPKWSRATPTQWIAGLKEKIAQHGTTNATVFGFSFGAYVAINTAREIPFAKIIACSLPPFFQADIVNIEPSTRTFLGTRRMADFENYAFPATLKTPIVFMSGEQEDKEDLVNMAHYHSAWSGLKKKVLVPNAEHDLETGDYLKAICAEIA